MDAAPNIASVTKGLLRVGYDASWFQHNLPLANGRTAPLVAFSGQPFDARTACVSAAPGDSTDESLVASLRFAAAPISIIAGGKRYEFWRHDEKGPRRLDMVGADQLDNYFDRNKKQLAPGAVYRAKVWGRFEGNGQLAFVDAGLLPLIESETGERITMLIVELVHDVQRSLGWKVPTAEQGKWLLKAVFWLLAAKILQDKRVERFIRLDLEDIDAVFDRVAQHYSAPAQGHERPLGKERRAALERTAGRIKAFANLRLLSTESLGYVYESALVDKATRQSLGTHSTPAWLIDYMIGRLRDRVEAMPVTNRRVFEPACGHAGFLIGGLRLLSELRPSSYEEDRKSYLRKRLRGIEIDSFAVEIARLSLTLADVPNPNGWALTNADMFEGDTLANEVANASIVLSNPPFERFDSDKRKQEWTQNKASETLRRVATHLPKGGIIGFVVPHNFLVSAQDIAVRKILASQYEIAEISVFADRVFRCGAPESAILIAQRYRTIEYPRFLYQRIRETEIDDFKHTYQPSSAESIEQSELIEGASSFLVPELTQVWHELASYSRLADHVTIGKGLEYKGAQSLPRGAVTESETRCSGCVRGFARWSEDVMLHGLPEETWLNIDPSVIRRPLSGTTVREPQVLMNYARVSRGPWCLKALIDQDGHAATSRFLVIRPREASLTLNVLWALLNSPLANAYMHTHSSKRDMLGKTLESMPVPQIDEGSARSLDSAVEKYLVAARSFRPEPVSQTRLFDDSSPTSTSSLRKDDLRDLLWMIDAEVLRLYNLSAGSEQQLLHLFAGASRGGVVFEQHQYFPKDYRSLSRLSDLIRILTHWDEISEQKEYLIDKKLQRRASEAELRELQELQRLTTARRELYAPLPLAALERIQADLERKGLWKE